MSNPTNGEIRLKTVIENLAISGDAKLHHLHTLVNSVCSYAGVNGDSELEEAAMKKLETIKIQIKNDQS